MPKSRKVQLRKYDKAMKPGKAAEIPLVRHSPKKRPMQLAGFAWFEKDRAYRRMPLAPPEKLPEAVDKIADCTAGGQIRFQTDSRKLAVRVELGGVAFMDHMPATGICGFDCYLGEPPDERYANTIRYDHRRKSYEHTLLDLKERQMRTVTLNFPLYMGVKEVLVGLERDARVLPPPRYDIDGRVVVYGTSITQGGCASRPGMCCTNILSRRLNVEFINLGFSGSGRGEPEVARTIAGLKRVALFVLDYEGNCGSTELLRETFPQFIRILREAHPEVLILAVSRTPFARDLFDASSMRTRLERKAFQRRTIEKLRRKGDRRIWFLDGSKFLGDDFDECTVDGVHPTDLGFSRIADALTPVIRKILKL